ncbi:hypothetical protein PV396_11055 [Streptomyces sp. ME02-8801-2C]|uniref:hypothetical protein n=1 Tax=Streptomyces sp. ME02-8801-2C TaxID=3028680 RepID=UPI0029BCB501|nr:hypothetical protein [Streptomyces sp. ME02-8801-2C]MDX3452477.1 hypothetical protein [Streptomyces sp. ME02-8801-2C]
MPVDLTAVAARFAAAFALQLKGAAMAQLAIGPVLTKRKAAAVLVERATRQYPVLRFEGDALTLSLAPGQSLTGLEPPPSLGSSLAQGGLDFLHGIARATAPFAEDSQDTAITRLLGGAERALRDIEEAVRRSATPTARMFDPGRATASDLFGSAALGFRAAAEAGGTGGALDRFRGQIEGAAKALQPPARPDDAAAANSAAVGGTSQPATSTVGQPESTGREQSLPAGPDLAQSLDESARLLTAGLLGTIAGPALLSALLNVAAGILRAVAVDTLAEAERTVLDLRRTAFETAFTELSGLARRGSALAIGAHGVIASNIAFQLRFAQLFFSTVSSGVAGFLTALSGYLADMVALLNAVPAMLTAFTAFDLTKLWQSKLGDVVGWVVDFSLDDLLDADGRRPNSLLHLQLSDAVLDARVLTLGLSDTLAHAQELVDALFGYNSKGYVTPELVETAPLAFRSAFPNLADGLFGGGRGRRVTDAVDRLGSAVRGGLGGALESAGTALTGLAAEFAADAARAARLGDGGPLTGLGERSAHSADLVLRPEVTASRPARGALDPLAGSFESWLAGGGFALLGEAIPAYVGQLAAYWEARLTETTELTGQALPTSPHILRRRALLEAVEVPRVLLRATPGRELDETLADAVAEQLATAVRGAYRTGLRELAARAGTGGRRHG